MMVVMETGQRYAISSLIDFDEPTFHRISVRVFQPWDILL